MNGYKDFIKKLADKYDVVLVSDAFKPLINHFCDLLENPIIECHEFSLDSDGFIVKALYSRSGGKQSLVKFFQDSGHVVHAIGDAFNDLEMLKMANKGFLYKPSKATRAAANDIKIVSNFNEVLLEVLTPSVNNQDQSLR